MASPRWCCTEGCERVAEFYWHDAGPFGAGTTYGCADHVPDDGLGDVWPLNDPGLTSYRPEDDPTLLSGPAPVSPEERVRRALADILAWNRRPKALPRQLVENAEAALAPVARAEQTGHPDPGHTFGPGFSALVRGSHTRASTDCGPDYCHECSEALQSWVRWPCHLSTVRDRQDA